MSGAGQQGPPEACAGGGPDSSSSGCFKGTSISRVGGAAPFQITCWAPSLKISIAQTADGGPLPEKMEGNVNCSSSQSLELKFLSFISCRWVIVTETQ